MKTYKFFFIAFLIACSTIVSAQPRGAGGNFKMPAIGHIYGKLIEAKSKEAIPFSSVALFKNDSVIGGVFSGNNGEFSLENLPVGTFKLKITAIGFKTYEQNVSISAQNIEQDLGNLKIETNETVLQEVDVVGEKSTVEMTIDRKVFNVDKNITSKGGTATDVMKNIPSVTLDADGNAQLRQNTATIYVDGRPTPLTLDQIPADQIERVEVITNPSAKFEASATGGIINIVMKSNSKPGYNGMVTGGIGTGDRYNGLAALNVKQKPIGLSVTYNYNTANNPVTGYTHRTSLLDGAKTGYFSSDDHTTFKRTFQSGTALLDYYMNNRNTLTVSENITSGDFISHGKQIFYTENALDSMLNNGNRATNSVAHFQHYTTTLHYRKTFPKKNKELTADASYTNTEVHSPSDYTTYTYAGNSSVLYPGNPELQNNVGLAKSQMVTIQSDYSNPINDSAKIEFGIRSSYKPSVQSLDVTQYNYSSNDYTPDLYLSSHYKIEDLVSAAYINYSMRRKKMNYMFGMRFEDSYYKGILTDKKDSSFLYSYPDRLSNAMNAFFPGIFISRKFNDKQELQFNVTRKINRPGFRQLMPFIMASDPKDYTIGNPNLTPEFINTAELNYNYILNKGNLFFTLFFRNTEAPLTNYNYTSAADSSILINTTINGKQSNTIGSDNTFKYTVFKGFEATMNINLYYTFIDASYNNVSYSNQGFYYTSKLNMTYHLPKGFSLQLSGNYESPKIIPQGTNKELYFADCGLSKDIHKFLTFTLSVSDIFDTKGRGVHYLTDQYSEDTWSRRETRYIKFTGLMRFGKADASLFKKRQKPQQDSENNDLF